MYSSLIRTRVVLLLVVVASISSIANRAEAEPIFMGGFGFINHPTNEEFLLLPGSSAIAVANFPEPSFGVAESMSMRIDLSTYETTSDPLDIETLTIVYADDGDPGDVPGLNGTITLTFAPATFTQVDPPSGIIGSGVMSARIISATTDIPTFSSPAFAGTTVSQFVGGSIQLTFTGALISAGTAPGGGGSALFDPLATASFTISTPEPTSVALAIMGSLGAIGLCYRMRRS